MTRHREVVGFLSLVVAVRWTNLRVLPATIWATLILPVSGSYADEYYFQKYSVAQGLPQSQVTSVLQSRDGYLWVATDGGGVARFDGATFSNLGVSDGLSSNAVSSMLEDVQGRIWFGTNKGLSVFDGSSFKALGARTLNGLPVRSLFQDGAGDIWVGTERGVFRYDGATLEPVFEDLAALQLGVNAIFEDRSGCLWMGTGGGGLVAIDEQGAMLFGTEEGLPGDFVQDILEDSRGTLWIATRDGIARHESDGFVAASFAGLDALDARALLETSDGELWLATGGGGVCRALASRWSCLTEDNGLSSNVVWALAEDREHNLWIGTYRGGLNRYSGQRFARFAAEGFGDDVVRSILEDRNGHLWFGTFRSGAAHWDGEHLVRYTKKDGLISNFVLSIFEDRDGNVWFGTFDGVSKFDGRRFVNFDTSDGLPDRVIRVIQQDSKGNLVFGANYGGVSVYDGVRFRNFSTDDGLSSERIATMSHGNGGVLWIGTGAGVTRYHNGSFSVFEPPMSAPMDVVAILEDENGHVWIGDYGTGLHRCQLDVNDRGVACITFTKKDGLLDETVVSLALDPHRFVWVGTESGVSKLDLDALELEGVASFQSYAPEDGFTGIECVVNALIVDQPGDVWIGTIAGAFHYRRDQDRTNQVAPIARVTGLELFSGAVQGPPGTDQSSDRLPRSLRLAHDQNHLTFDYVALSFTSPSKVKYQSMLDGWDSTWNPPTRQRRATYPKLAPGPYEFRVRAANGDGVWSVDEAAYAFVIAPPFWRTPWFIAVAAVTVFSGLFGFVKIRLWTLEEQRRTLEGLVADSTSALRREKEKVERINSELEDRVAQRTQQVTRAHETLKEEIEQRRKLEEELLNARKLESLSVLAGGIAHDFNNLLTAMLGNISFARRLMRSDDRVSRLLREAEAASFRARDLTEQLLTFSKGGEPIKKVISLRDLVRETAEFALVGSSANSTLDLPETLWPVHADSGQVSQVIQNLVLNASQAMPDGGVITIRGRNLRLGDSQIGGLGAGDYVHLTVADEGHGIARDDLRRIFDPYFTTKADGVGLGLAGAYSIVKKHDGVIRADSEPGEGTTIHVYLPASRGALCDPSDHSDPDLGAGVLSHAKERILIMDDDESVRLLSQEVLLNDGYQVDVAPDGETMLALYQQAQEAGEPFALVIMDLTVRAGMGGREAIPKLKRLDPNVKAVVSSGYSNDPVMAEYYEHGFCAVLPKPFGASALESVLKRALSGSS